MSIMTVSILTILGIIVYFLTFKWNKLRQHNGNRNMKKFEIDADEIASLSLENEEIVGEIIDSIQRDEKMKTSSHLKNKLAKQLVSHILSDHIFFQCRVIHNFLFYGKINGKLESFKVDHILITPRSIIIIDSKNEEDIFISATRNEWVWKFEKAESSYYDLSHAKLNEIHIMYLHSILNGDYLSYSILTYVGKNFTIKYVGSTTICTDENLKNRLQTFIAKDYYYNEPLIPVGLIYDTLEDINVSGIEKYERAHRVLLQEKREKINFNHYKK